MVQNYTDSPRGVLRSVNGQDYRFAPSYVRKRDPTLPLNSSIDIRPPEQQGYYPIGSFWINTVNNRVFILVNIIANKAEWVLLNVSVSQPILDFIVDASTPPGTNPVQPDALGNVTITGGQVASGVVGANVIRSDSLAANKYTIEIQRSAASAAPNSALNGVSHFNSSQFTVDANSFVSLVGGGGAIESIATDINGPAVPNGSGQVSFLASGGVGTTIFSDGVGNNVNLNVQAVASGIFVGAGNHVASTVVAPSKVSMFMATGTAPFTDLFDTNFPAPFTYNVATVGGNQFISVNNNDNTNGFSASYIETGVAGLSSGSTFFRNVVNGGSPFSWATGINTPSGSSAWGLYFAANAQSNPQIGSANRLLVTSSGNVTKPGNSCASVSVGTALTNVTGDGTIVTPVIFNNVFFDQNGNYNPATGLFTAPVTGTYLVTVAITFSNLLAAHSLGQIRIVPPSQFKFCAFNPGISQASDGTFTANASGIVQVSAGGTIQINVIVSGSTKTVTINGDFFGSFSYASFNLIS